MGNSLGVSVGDDEIIYGNRISGLVLLVDSCAIQVDLFASRTL